MTNSRPHITRNSATIMVMNTSNIMKSETYRRQCKIKYKDVTQTGDNSSGKRLNIVLYKEVSLKSGTSGKIKHTKRYFITTYLYIPVLFIYHVVELIQILIDGHSYQISS